jgi:hypothetical protein
MIHRDTELPAFDSPRTLRQTGRSACPRFVKTLLNLAEARVARAHCAQLGKMNACVKSTRTFPAQEERRKEEKDKKKRGKR